MVSLPGAIQKRAGSITHVILMLLAREFVENGCVFTKLGRFENFCPKNIFQKNFFDRLFFSIEILYKIKIFEKVKKSDFRKS